MLVRDFDLNHDWEDFVRLRNLIALESHVTTSEVAGEFQRYRDRSRLEYCSCTDGPRIAGIAFVFRSSRSTIQDRDRCVAFADNDDAYRPMLEDVLSRTNRRAATSIEAHARTNQPGWVRALEGYGFEIIQRNPVSRLDLTSVVLPQTTSQKFEIVSLDELRHRDSAWAQRYHALHIELLRDVPTPTPATDQTFEDFMAELERVPWLVFFAVADGHLIGTTELQLTEGWSDASTGLTGVRTGYRRQGVARSLKLHAAKWARDHGIQGIWTDNEEDNPMLALNESLGFRRQYDLEIYLRS